MEGGTPDAWHVPDAWRTAAEEVRQHLCALRGGALFLSSADALQLVRWLHAGVPVGDVLRALERAGEARRSTRSRIPLNLSHARRHLGRPTQGMFAREVPVRGREPVFAPIVRALACTRYSGPARTRLEATLSAIDAPADEAVRQALAAIRTFLDECWSDLGVRGRAALRAKAREDLGDLVNLIDEATTEALVEEGARDLLRQQAPCLTAASLWELVQTDAR